MSGTVEEWDRRKKYLVRSLFEDKPTLSPIPEIVEQSLVHTPTPQVHIIRPLSPLPELIIEVEHNRHDEPEEYYKVLEEEVKIIYKKLFKRQKIISLEDEHDQISVTAEAESMESEYSIGTEQFHSNSINTSISSETNSTFTCTSQNLVLTQAEVHQAAIEVELSDLVYRTVSSKEETSSNDQSDVTLLLNEPELVRRQEKNETFTRSIQELNNEEAFRSDADITVEKAASFSPRAMLPMDLAEETSYISIEELECNGGGNVHEHSSSPKRRNLGIQTCFSSSSGENSWHDIKTYFFQGKAHIYKLCSCRNHTCKESYKRF